MAALLAIMAQASPLPDVQLPLAGAELRAYCAANWAFPSLPRVSVQDFG